MGEMIRAVCTHCGYTSKGMLQGIGLSYAAEGIFYEPAYCDTCGITEAMDGREMAPKCSSCHGGMHFYHKQAQSSTTGPYLPPKVDYTERKGWHCPACRQESLTFISIGLWD